MGDNNNRVCDLPPVDATMGNLLAPMVRAVKVNERNILMNDYTMLPIVENQSSIIYPPYGQADQAPDYHLSRFMEYFGNFKYQGVNDKALKTRLLHYTLKKSRKWLDLLPSNSINHGQMQFKNFPSHQFLSASENHYFYFVLTPNSRSAVDFTVVDSATTSFIQNRSVREIHDLYETMSEQFVIWPDRGSHKKTTRMHGMDINILLLTKINVLSN
ncbi:Uncharacterized protein Adt_03350 [Abeliophyllum distichum]|uniref:Uncharacterized protein n=1 Tax=Abeliophyllum distichum TaxID=126358 RepID=A0ABD1VYH7_9LAMI